MQRDVVVVMHSFAGMTGGTALDGLDKESRLSKNLSGGVVRLIYVAAFMVPEGFQHSPQGTRENMIPQMKTNFEVRRPYTFTAILDWPRPQGGIVTVQPQDAKAFFYQDVDDEDIAELVKDLQPQSLASFWSTTTHAAWRYIPTTYILCTADVPTTVLAAQHLVDSAKASGTHRIDKVINVDAGHSPFISKPAWTAGVFVEEADRSF
jgi:pimeloyl-ACP methyl ester carboxylesterase